ncbi:MAG: hypothetical protein ACK56I_01655, partial [bacterium]
MLPDVVERGDLRERVRLVIHERGEPRGLQHAAKIVVDHGEGAGLDEPAERLVVVVAVVDVDPEDLSVEGVADVALDADLPEAREGADRAGQEPDLDATREVLADDRHGRQLGSRGHVALREDVRDGHVGERVRVRAPSEVAEAELEPAVGVVVGHVP